MEHKAESEQGTSLEALEHVELKQKPADHHHANARGIKCQAKGGEEHRRPAVNPVTPVGQTEPAHRNQDERFQHQRCKQALKCELGGGKELPEQADDN